MTLNPFHGTGLFLCPLKTSGNLLFSNVPQGISKEKVTSVRKWFKDNINNMSAKCCYSCLLHNRACFLIVDPHWCFQFTQELKKSLNAF